MLARLPALAALAAFFAVVACARVDTAGGGGAGGRTNAWTHPGILRIVDLQEPDTLNPLVGNAQLDSDLANFWGGMLLNWSDKNEFVSELATEVPTLANGGISKDNRQRAHAGARRRARSTGALVCARRRGNHP